MPLDQIPDLPDPPMEVEIPPQTQPQQQGQPQVVVVPVQQMPNTRARRPPQPPAARRPPAQPSLARFFPSAATEKIKVRWLRPDDGQLVSMGTYSSREVGNYGSIEEFLERVVVPKYKKYGDFYVAYLSPTGEEREDTFPIMEPATLDNGRSNGHQDSPVSVLGGLLQEQMKRRQEDPQLSALVAELKRDLGLQGTQVDPALASRLARLEQLLERPSDNPLVLRLVDEVSKLAAAQQEMRMAAQAAPAVTLPPPGPDPVLLAKEVARDVADAIVSRMPQQPSAPTVDPLTMMNGMMQGFQNLAAALKPTTPTGPDPAVVKLQEQVDKQRDELVKAREDNLKQQLDRVGGEITELKRALTSGDPPQRPADQIKEMGEMIDVLERVTGRDRRREGSTSVAEALRDIMHGLPETIREAGTAFDKARQRDEAAAERSRQAKEALAAKQRRAAAAAAASAAKGAPAAVKEAPATGKCPPELVPYIKRMADADSDGESVKATLACFKFIAASDERWNQGFQQTMALVKRRDHKAVEFIDALLDNCEKVGVLPADRRGQIHAVFAGKFDEIANLLFPKKEG